MRSFTGAAIFACLLFGSATILRAQDTPSTTVTGVSRAFNPAISVNGLFLGRATTAIHEEPELGEEPAGEEHGEGQPGLQIQEVEMQFASFVDPYLKANIILSVPGGEGLEMEEGSIQLLNLPANLGFRFGKLFGPFGKHNLLHTHAFPFIDPPMISSAIFGGEGLKEVGVEGSVLLPLPWFSEPVVQVVNGDNENLFASGEAKDLAYIAHWKNLFDLTPDMTLEIGASGAVGAGLKPVSANAESTSNVVGGDVTLKWKATGGKYTTVILQSEYLRGEANDAIAKGGYGLAQVRFSRRFWAQGRFDWASGFGESGTDKRVSGLVAFVPTEFSALRAQYNLNRHVEEDAEHEVLFQYNFTIGSHPAHAY